MNFLVRLKVNELIRVFLFGGLMIFLSDRAQFLFLLFLIFLVLGLLTGEFKYFDDVPIDKVTFQNYQFSNFVFSYC